MNPFGQRRRAITALGASAIVSGFAAAPRHALAQTSSAKVRRIGFLAATSRATSKERIDALLLALREKGWNEGGNLAIEWRFADGDFGRLPGLAAELVRANVELIVSSSTAAARAAQKASATIPIVALSVGDPVGTGLAATLARPGGNVTGFSIASQDFFPKRLELIRLALPDSAAVAVLGNPDAPTYPGLLKNMQATSAQAGIRLLHTVARTHDEIDRAFAQMAKERVRAVVVLADSIFFEHARHIAALGLKHRIAIMSAFRATAVAGALMSYGPDETGAFSSGATYVDKILKGAKAGELPFQLPARYFLTINRKTAAVLGLKLPRDFELRVDEMIE